MKALSALTFGLLLAACLAPAIEASSVTGELVMSEASAPVFWPAWLEPAPFVGAMHPCDMCVHERMRITRSELVHATNSGRMMLSNKPSKPSKSSSGSTAASVRHKRFASHVCKSCHWQRVDTTKALTIIPHEHLCGILHVAEFGSMHAAAIVANTLLACRRDACGQALL